MTKWQQKYPLSNAYHGNRRRLGLEETPWKPWYAREETWLKCIMLACVLFWVCLVKWFVS